MYQVEIKTDMCRKESQIHLETNLMKNICNMGLHAVTQCGVRKYPQLRQNSPRNIGDWNTLCSLIPIDPEVYIFQTGSGSDIPIIIQPTIFMRVHSVHAVGRIRLGARKLPSPPKFKYLRKHLRSTSICVLAQVLLAHLRTYLRTFTLAQVLAKVPTREQMQ